MKRLINFLACGRRVPLSQAIQRKVRLNCILLSIAILFVSVVAIVDGYFRQWMSFPLFIIVLVIYSFALFLNRQGYHLISRLLLPLISMLLVFMVIVTRENPVALWFYIIIAIASITLFRYEEKRKSILLTIACCSLFILSFYWLIAHGSLTFTSMYNAIIFMTSYIFCMAAGIIIIFIPIRHEYYAEQQLVGLTNELKDKQRKYEVIHAASGAIFYEYDLVANRVPANLQVNRMLGYEDSELREYTFEESAALIHPDDRPLFNGKIAKALSNGDAITLEYRVKKKSGDYTWVSAASVIERDENNQPRWMIGSLMNINDRKIAEQRVLEQNDMLLKTNAELDNFVYHVSHDIRAPISSILGLVNLAKTADSTELMNLIHMMGERACVLDRFIHDVLAYSKNARSEVDLAEVNLHDLVMEITRNFDYLENNKRVSKILNIPNDLQITIDTHRIKIILGNLLCNSIKYFNPYVEKPFVKFTYVRNCTTHSIIVEDNGRGIHSEYLGKIFDMFFRATDNDSGSGLGLYIAKEVVEKLQGSIKVESDIGKGSTFIVEWPIVKRSDIGTTDVLRELISA